MLPWVKFRSITGWEHEKAHPIFIPNKVNLKFVLNNVLKIGPGTESKKLQVHGSLIGPVVEPQLNR